MPALLLSLLMALPSAALDFDSPAADNSPFLAGFRSEPQVQGRVPYAELAARREGAALPAGKALLTPVFDSAWNVYLSVRLPGAGAPVCVWKEAELDAGVVCSAAGLTLRGVEGRLRLTWDGGALDTDMGELFDLLYGKSPRVVFGQAVAYALVRNLEPGTGKEGVVTMRLGSDGLYYWSLTPDEEILPAPRWLLAVNGVLYGLRAEGADLLFLSKVIDGRPKLLARERPYRP